MAVTVDLALIREAIFDALRAVDALDGILIDKAGLGNKPDHAMVDGQLLNLSDQLLLASALVKTECWTGLGIPSHGY
jgi:hypothetical protein